MGVVLGALARAFMRLVAVGMGVDVQPEFNLGASIAILSLFALSGAGAGAARSLELPERQSAIVVLGSSLPLLLTGLVFSIGETREILDLDLTPPWTVELLAMSAVIAGLVLVTPYAGWRVGRRRRRRVPLRGRQPAGVRR
jgi:hypothetical protein